MKIFTNCLLLVAFSLLAFTQVKAQQIPVYNQYIQNPYLYNPAAAGVDTFAHLNLTHRTQWIDVPDGPITSVATFDMPFKGDRIGVGAQIFSDKAHILNRMGASVTYAYHVPFNDDNSHKLSIGLSVGILSQRINILDARVVDINDSAFLNEEKSSTTVDFSAGVLYTNGPLRIGLAVPQVAGNNIKYTGEDGSENKFGLERHFLGSIAYRLPFGVDDVLSVEPSVLIRYIPNLPFQADINVLGSWDETVLAGIGYRLNDASGAIYASAGVRIKNQFGVMYTYEMPLDANDGTTLGTSHEFTLSYRFGHKKTVEEVDRDLQSFKRDVNDRVSERDSLLKDLQSDVEDIQIDVSELEDRVDTLESRPFMIAPAEPGEIPSFDVNLDYKKIGFVLFEQGAHTLTDEAKSKLENVRDLLANTANVVNIYLQGRASQEGDANYNLILSTRRAVAVKKHLRSLGLPEDNIILIPYGEEDPVTDDQNTEEEKAENRRVDIFIISN
ncbi:MAG: PorP/SprF family type IX secretion system membrane protein [Bacteroidota bacterium]